MAVDLLGSSTKFPRVLLNELPVRPGLDSTIPNRRGRSLEKEQLASESSKPSIERCDVAPLHHARANAVGQVQGIDEQKTPRARVLLHAGMQPFDCPNDALQMAQVRIHGKRAVVLRQSQRAVGMRLRQVNQRPDLPGLRGSDVATDESVDQRRLSHAGRAFQKQRPERGHSGYPTIWAAAFPLAMAHAAAV